MRRMIARTLLGSLLVVAGWPSCAVGQDAMAPPRDIFRLGVRAGVQLFSYEEREAAVRSEYDTAGLALGLTGMLRLGDRFRITGDYLGAFLAESSETWRDVDTPFGVGTQHNDLSLDFHVLDLDLGYSVLKRDGFEWAIVAGWHAYWLGFERGNFTITTATVIIGAPGLSVTEDVAGQGVKLGTVLEARVAPRVWVEAGFAGYYVYDVDVENSALGSLESEGHALRWRLALDYFLNPRVTLGAGYEGHFIHVDRATSAIAILPENKTWAHTLTVRLGVWF
ncbi:MAG: hypothetical protein ACREJ9_01185 [Candidatus Rokuibacteriota bacterium]